MFWYVLVIILTETLERTAHGQLTRHSYGAFRNKPDDGRSRVQSPLIRQPALLIRPSRSPGLRLLPQRLPLNGNPPNLTTATDLMSLETVSQPSTPESTTFPECKSF